MRCWPPSSQQLESENSPRRNPKPDSVRTNHALAIAEFTSAVGIRVRSRALPAETAARALSLFDLWVSTSTDHAAVVDADHHLAGLFVRRFELGLRVPDALHLAVAHRLALPLLTFDLRQAAAAAALGIPCDPAGATGGA